MKKFLITALIAITGFAAQAQVQETRRISEFTRIEVKNGIEVIITQGDKASVKVESDDYNKIKNIMTEYNGDVLKIYGKGNVPVSDSYKVLRVYVTQKNITGLRASSGASIKLAAEMNANGLAIDLSSGATFKGKVNCAGAFKLDAGSGSYFDGIVVTDLFHGDLKGGAVVKIAGMAKNSVINSTNSATCLAANFKCQNVKVNAKNTSSVVVNVENSIKANSDDTASITYYGSPSETSLGAESYAVKRN